MNFILKKKLYSKLLVIIKKNRFSMENPVIILIIKKYGVKKIQYQYKDIN